MSSRRGVFVSVLLVGVLALVGGAFIRHSLSRLEAELPAVESGRLRDSFVALGDLHRLTLALAEADDAETQAAIGADARKAVDYLYVRADTLRKTAGRDTQDMRLLGSIMDRLVVAGDAFLQPGAADIGAFRAAALPLLEQANRNLIGFVNARKNAESQAIARQTQTLRSMTLTTAALLALFSAVSICAALLWRAETRAEAGRRAAEARAWRLAYFDQLTGLGNRVHFTERANAMLGKSWAGRNGPALILIDLDEFKLVNDTHGHDVGDAMLEAVAQRIDAVVSTQGGVSARLGGDEFAAILPAGRTSADLVKLCERLQTAIKAPLFVKGAALGPKATMGVAEAREEHEEVGALLKAADLALYQAKQAGRDGYAFFDADLAAAARERRELETALAEAIGGDSFELHYQPQVCLGSGAIYGVEALARWRRAGQMVSPAEFIPVAESTGLILDLDIWGLRTATRQVAGWMRDGAPPISVSVNLSPLHFRDDAILRHVRSALLESGLPPHLLTLEVTETLLLEDWDRIVRLIRQLHELGVRIALDDFGVGYSSLGYLRKLKADQLKIDRSFLNDIEQSGESQAMLSALVGLARALEIDLLVEGVETEGQYALLRELGCSRAQGFLFSKPTTADVACSMVQSPPGWRAAAWSESQRAERPLARDA